jgi:hypothetical protein
MVPSSASEKFPSDITGNRSRDLPTSSAVNLDVYDDNDDDDVTCGCEILLVCYSATMFRAKIYSSVDRRINEGGILLE